MNINNFLKIPNVVTLETLRTSIISIQVEPEDILSLVSSRNLTLEPDVLTSLWNDELEGYAVSTDNMQYINEMISRDTLKFFNAEKYYSMKAFPEANRNLRRALRNANVSI